MRQPQFLLASNGSSIPAVGVAETPTPPTVCEFNAYGAEVNGVRGEISPEPLTSTPREVLLVELHGSRKGSASRAERYVKDTIGYIVSGRSSR